MSAEANKALVESNYIRLYNNYHSEQSYFLRNVIDHFISHIKQDNYLLFNYEVPDSALKTDIIQCEADYDLNFDRFVKVNPFLRSNLKAIFTVDHFLDTPFMNSKIARKFIKEPNLKNPTRALYGYYP